MTDTHRANQARALWLGRIATFQAQPKQPRPRYAGQIIRVDFTGRQEPGNVPNFRLTVRGRTGKVATVDLLDQRADIFPTWPEAIEDTEVMREASKPTKTKDNQ